MKTILLKSDGCRVTSDELTNTALSRHALLATRHTSRVTRHSRAFTIVELLVVIAIIAILAALLLPVLNKAKESGKKTQAKTEMSQIATGIQQYDSVYGRFPVSSAAQNQAAQNAQAGFNPDFTYGGTFTFDPGPPLVTVQVGTPVNGLISTNSEVIAILMDLTNCPDGSATINTNHQKNPQQTIFLNAKIVDTNQNWSGVGQDLVYRDPWGNPYLITMDLNYDEQCRDAFYCSNTISGRTGKYNPGLNGLVSPTATATVAGQDDFQYHGKVMVWSAGPDGKFDPLSPANLSANKDNILSWQ